MSTSNDLPNVHIVKVAPLPITNTKPARIKVTSSRFNQTLILSVSYQYNTYVKQVIAYLEERGIPVMYKDCTNNDYALLVCSDVDGAFKPLKD